MVAWVDEMSRAQRTLHGAACLGQCVGAVIVGASALMPWGTLWSATLTGSGPLHAASVAMAQNQLAFSLDQSDEVNQLPLARLDCRVTSDEPERSGPRKYS